MNEGSNVVPTEGKGYRTDLLHGQCCIDVLSSNKKRKWQPTPVFLPGEFHGQRSLAGYSLEVGDGLST